MNKITTMLSKNIMLAGVGIITIAGIAYMGVTGGDPAPVLPSNAQEKPANSTAESDPTYINTAGNDAVGGTNGMPENWPKDAPAAYVGATLLSSVAKNLGTGKNDPTVIYFSDISGPEMIAYYVKGLELNGWKIEANADSAGYRIITAKKDTRLFASFVSVGADGKTGVTSGVTF